MIEVKEGNITYFLQSALGNTSDDETLKFETGEVKTTRTSGDSFSLIFENESLTYKVLKSVFEQAIENNETLYVKLDVIPDNSSISQDVYRVREVSDNSIRIKL
ncbi:hypothetical protein [Macrococcus armenti]|uniref:hypothetical protein n=1 Tax=Macrococcus armenti TaxID=2875764 RepID=UPI001CCF0E7D|nr:hypothetical protein [Macrococcus armenti]UBH16416.1 hypothetical protein LAU44_05530 [Macrococcus armenti]UBH18772.1 hypothetical protein LAU39_05540 [Macrococcus armenti]UBH21044.1 hypothetical protein LAU40_05535 [Macrococcus armenti]